MHIEDFFNKKQFLWKRIVAFWTVFWGKGGYTEVWACGDDQNYDQNKSN